VRILLVCNPTAGGGRGAKVLPAVQAALSDHDVQTELTRSLEHAGDLAAAGCASGQVVAALGGDGLAGRCAGVVASHGGVLAVLPGGRGNDFVRCLGAPRDPVAAARALGSAVERRLDLGVAGGQPFLGIASVGFDSDVQVLANRTRVKLGSTVYLYAALRTVASWKPATFGVRIDDEPERELVGWSVAAANSSFYGGGMRYAPSATLDDGLLDVVLASRTGRGAFLRAIPKVYAGKHVTLPTIEVMQARRITVDADRKFQVYADGDPVADLPATIEIRPGALRALVPAPLSP
jgi:YegS/Rv2252/BmrU family lipid kinase